MPTSERQSTGPDSVAARITAAITAEENTAREALRGPTLVLRRCARDRELVELHKDDLHDGLCGTCGLDGQTVDCDGPCDTLRAIAEDRGIDVSSTPAGDSHRDLAVRCVAEAMQGPSYGPAAVHWATQAVDALIADGWGPRPTVSKTDLFRRSVGLTPETKQDIVDLVTRAGVEVIG